MDPVVNPPLAETASGRSAARLWWRRAVWGLSGLLVVGGLLAGVVAWMLRPEALRQRVEAGLVQALGRSVLVRAADWHWQPAPAGSHAPAQIVVFLHGVEVPPAVLEAGTPEGRIAASGAASVVVADDRAQRGLQIEQMAVFLRAVPGEWWRAWRGELPWPVTALRAQGLVTRPPGVAVADSATDASFAVRSAANDRLGELQLERLELTGIVAAAHAPRVLRMQARGRWQGAPERSWVPLSADLRDVALTPGFAGGFSLDQAVLQFGALQARLADVSVGQDSATFAVEVAPVNLREALSPLGIPVPATEDAKAFARVAVQAECHVDFDLANRGAGCDSVVLKVDDTTFTGQAWRAPLGRPGTGEYPEPNAARSLEAPAAQAAPRDASTVWQLRLAADQLNLDRYLPPDNLEEPPTAVPWNLADAWPLRVDLTVRDLRVAGLRFRNAKLVLQAGEQGLVRE